MYKTANRCTERPNRAPRQFFTPKNQSSWYPSPILTDYLDRAEFECLRKGMGHEPHMLFQAFNMHKEKIYISTLIYVQNR
jgi:hypothetical protein